MVCLALATPVAKTCDAGGGALRSQRREWPGTDYWANLVRAGTLANAAVRNICITSELLVTHHLGHWRRVHAGARQAHQASEPRGHPVGWSRPHAAELRTDAEASRGLEGNRPSGWDREARHL